MNDTTDKLGKDKKTYDTIIKELVPKIEENESLQAVTASLLKENDKHDRFLSIEKEINAINEKLNISLKLLAESFIEYRGIHQKYEDKINSSSVINTDDLKFSVETPFRMEMFVSLVLGIFDNRSLKAIKNIIDIDEMTQEWFTTDNLIMFIEACLNGEIRTTHKKTPESALREVLADWNNTTYKVQMDGDSIDDMSPGKKALALLIMLINLAESECPILIDQPEDDLDNRSIFDELIP